jgi:hypothetical protein
VIAPSADALSIAGVEIGLLLITGLVVSRRGMRLVLASLLACVCIALPWLLPAQPAWLRFTMALASLFSILRTIEVANDRRDHPALVRMLAFVGPLDAFAATRATPRIDARGIAAAIGWATLGAVAWTVTLHAPTGAWRVPIALVASAIGMLVTMDALSALDRALLRMFGIETPAVQDAPIRSRSITEFWGRRWNRAVGAWLRKHCFAPLARRKRPVLGVLASFAASAAIHFWPVLVAVGWEMASRMAAFFVVQALLVLLEARWGAARWPPLAGHAWTIAWMLATSPLFMVPILAVLGFRT